MHCRDGSGNFDYEAVERIWFKDTTVTPTILRIRPFGEYVKRLSLFCDETYVAQGKVQQNGVEDLATNGTVCTAPEIRRRLAPVEELHARFGARFVDIPDASQGLVDQRRLALQFVPFRFECGLVD